MITARQISRKLMDCSIAIAPKHMQEWTDAMRSETDYVEGTVELLGWSFGCFRTVLRESLLHAFSRRLTTGGRSWSAGGAKELSMRKLILIASVILATLVGFLLAPSFRQAISVAGKPYLQIFSDRRNVGPSVSQLLAMRDRAMANRDAKSLALIALLMPQAHIRHSPPMPTDRSYEGELSIAIAKQAVAIDPQYTFIYLQLAGSNQGSPKFPHLIDALHLWDPDNSAIYLAEAEHSLTGRWKGPNYTVSNVQFGPAWTANMEKAFRSPKYDTYYAQTYNLILWASANHILNDPMTITFAASRIGTGSMYDIRQYAQKLLSDNSVNQSQKLANAREVAQFADVMAAGAVPWFEKTVAQGIASDAARAMTAISAGQDVANAVAQNRRQTMKLEVASLRNDPLAAMMAAMESNASAVQVSVLVMAASLLVLTSVIIRCAVRRHVSPSSVVALWINAAVFFGSCVTCYVAYRPFATILEYLERNSNPNNARLAFVFWSFVDNPLIRVFADPTDRALVGWITLLVLCTIALAWIAARQIVRFAQRNVPAHS